MAAHVSVSVFFPHCLSLLISLPVHVCVCVHKAGDRSVLQLADTQYSNSWAPACRRRKAQAAGEVTGAQDFPLAPQSTFNLYCQLFLTHTHTLIHIHIDEQKHITRIKPFMLSLTLFAFDRLYHCLLCLQGSARLEHEEVKWIVVGQTFVSVIGTCGTTKGSF